VADVALRFGATDDGLTAQFRRVSGQLSNFERESSRVGSAVTTTFARVGTAIAGIAAGGFAVREVLQFADSLDKAANQTGIAVESLQRLQFIAGQVGTSTDAITRAVNRLQVTLVSAGEGSSEAAKALERLGIPVQDFINLAPEQQFEKVAQQIASIEAPADRAATAIGLFGRGGAELLPVLTRTGEELAQIETQFIAIGGPVSAEAIASVDNIGDSLGNAALAAKSLGTELLAIVAPAILGGLNAINTTLGALRFAFRGFTGNNEAVNLSNQIDALKGKAQAFQNALNPEGKKRFAALSAEIAVLQRQLDALNETNSFVAPRLKEATLGFPGIAPTQTIPQQSGTPQPTPAELRLQSLQDQPATLNLLNENFELEQVATQAHLDALLAQYGEFGNFRVQQESAIGGALVALREQYGVQEINFEDLKSATIQDIQQSLLTSGLQIATALFGQNKKVALAVAAINIGEAATKALTLPYPANLAAVARVIAQGAQLTQRIRSASIGGGGGFGGVSGGGVTASPEPAAAAAPAGAQSKAATNVYISGFISRAVVDDLVEVLRGEGDRDVTLFGGNSRQALEFAGAT
jgi:hypothetical protein